MICKKCLEEKESAEFYPKMNTCKKCHKIRCRDWALKNPDKIKQMREKEKNKTKLIEKKLEDGWKHRGIKRRRDKYYLDIYINGKRTYIGNLSTKKDAVDAYFIAKNKAQTFPIIENNMVKIPLDKWSEKNKKTEYAIIDLDDYKKAKKYNWSLSNGYACNNKIRLHQLIMGGKMVDHINGNKLDNRKSNLRFASRKENVRNSKKPIHTTGYHKNSSIYKGVMKRKDYEAKWRARIRYNYKYINIGTFESEIEAAKAYDKKAIELFGEFACINFPVNNIRCALN